MKDYIKIYFSNMSWKKIRKSFSLMYFMKNHWGHIVLSVVCVLVLIENQYICNTYITQLAKCEKILKSCKAEALTKKSQMTKKIQQSNIKRLIEKKGISLSESVTPPFILDK